MCIRNIQHEVCFFSGQMDFANLISCEILGGGGIGQTTIQY